MKRTLEAIFRRLNRLLILVILLPTVGLAVAFFLPRSYQTTARLWAWHPIQDLTVASQGSSTSTANQEIDPQTDVPITPAQSQVNALSQYLQTNDFARAVVGRIALASTLGHGANAQANSQQRNQAIIQDISSHVYVVVQGHNLFSVSYTNRDPHLAQQVVEAVIQLYDSQSRSFILSQGQKLLDAYQKQLLDARLNASRIASVQAQYLLTHPGLNGNALLADSQYQLLNGQQQEEQAYITSIQTIVANLNQTISQNASPGSVFMVLDAPATQVISRTMLFLIAGAVGLGTALLACIVYILIVVRRDRVVYTTFDLQKVTALPVVTQIPYLSPRAVPLSVNGSVRNDSKER